MSMVLISGEWHTVTNANDYSVEELKEILGRVVDEESDLWRQICERFEESDKYRDLNK